ncbi:MAG: 4Fe-4S binding protein [Deltaproteobacteria bacterium]|nr:4Fe-4S binding protein [Deltaproteobacteria bacterium]MBW1996253.1 4Fe-4S binding protein [Deltaproteobacteria bacterium]MBW2150352.1 4Fe-4S binding protein [Deltaproteobacteria bacterium]
MLANYGYKDGSGDYFITIDTDKCDGCGECVTACPAQVFAVADEDPNDPMREDPVAVVADEKKKKLKYECNPCKPSSNRAVLPCVKACESAAISHSW